jgi:OOP family OmpA-OmpF porin
MTVAPAAATSYKLACKGKGGSAESSVNVSVAAPVLDSDKDGVPDNLDKCPNTRKGAKVDKDGCEIIECKSMTLSITFDTGKSEIKPKHFDELKMVADKLVNFSKATTVIEGHTDNVGSAAANAKLSQRRADAVRAYIVNTYGIDGSRISAKGYGQTKPIDSNKTEEGRKNNRRVEAVFNCP